MLFSKVKECDDDRVFQAGLDTLVEFKDLHAQVKAFGCCFVKDRLVISFGYEIPYPKEFQKAMAMEVMKKLPEEYTKIDYYPSDIFDEKCCKHYKNQNGLGLWCVIDGAR